MLENDLPFWKERLATEMDRLTKLYIFSKGVEHSGTMDCKREIKRLSAKITEPVESMSLEIESLKAKLEKAKILLREYEICICCVNDSKLKIEQLPKDHPCNLCRLSNINGLNWKFNEELLES